MKELLISGFFGGIIGGIVVAFLRPFVDRVSQKILRKTDEKIRHINQLRQALNSTKKKYGFYERFRELDKIADQLKYHFSDKDKENIRIIEREIKDIKQDYEKCTPTEAIAYSGNNKVSKKYYDFLSSVLNRLEKKTTHRFLRKIF